MVLSLVHSFISAKSDGSDNTLVQPSNWNAAHTISGATAGDLPYASGSTTLAALAIGGSNSVLTSSGSAPQWSTALTLTGNVQAASHVGNSLVLDTANQDVVLARDAANTLALRNSTTAQTFNIYNTYTDASNWERTNLQWFSNQFFIQSRKSGSGTDRDIVISAGGALWLGSSEGQQWLISSGSFVAAVDNTADIGTSGANRPRTLYLAANLGIGGADPSTTTFLKMAVGTMAKSQVNWGTTSVAPSSPNDGDMWFDGTNIKIRISGATKTVTVV
jgi:hypothetical protein